MTIKLCTKCGQSKSFGDFHKQAKAADGLAPHCKTCRKKIDANKYRNRTKTQRVRYERKNAARKHEVAKRVFEYLQQHPCVDCPETDPVVLEFDHVRGKKMGDIGVLSTRWSWERLLTEIKKCDVRCANCHRRVTAKRGGWKRHQFAAKD